MKWMGGRQSGNIEDRRGSGGGGGRGLAFGGGLGAMAIALLAYLFGFNPSDVMSDGSSQPTQTTQVAGQNDEQKQFVATVLGYTEDVWNEQFRQMGSQYIEPKLVLFTDFVQSGCGNASRQVGPFYCPLDQKVYLDLSFFNELENRFGANGEFARAYVIAHEVGHHVQNLLGTSDKVQRLQSRVGEREANRLSVALELQADFYAGLWANHAQQMFNILEKGDIESALNAASAIGDDKLQMQSQGYVVPDAFTHGTSEQRVYWFKKGFQTGDINQGNTFDDL